MPRIPILLQRLKLSESASVSALNCLGACCEEIEEEWGTINQTLSAILAEKIAELELLHEKQQEGTNSDLQQQIEAKKNVVKSWRLRIANWKDEQDWADDDEDY